MFLKAVKFHIKNDDYFGTLATVLSLVEQDVMQNGFLDIHSDLLKKKVKELVYLQAHYKIIDKK